MISHGCHYASTPPIVAGQAQHRSSLDSLAPVPRFGVRVWGGSRILRGQLSLGLPLHKVRALPGSTRSLLSLTAVLQRHGVPVNAMTTSNKDPKAISTPNTPRPGRRSFLQASAGTGLLTAIAGLVPNNKAKAADYSPSTPDPSSGGSTRADSVEAWRSASNQQQRLDALALGDQLDNNDESLYASSRYLASFTKTLPCNSFGEVDPSAMQTLITAMESGAASDFNAIPQASAAQRGLANPQGAFKKEPSGLDGHASRIAPSHTFNSSKLAGEMVELYWQAIVRDIPFEDYGSNSLVSAAVSDLNGLTHTPAAASHGTTTAQNLFRGETPGDLVGPYISQFLWQDYSFGSIDVVQKYQTPHSNSDFMTTTSSWLEIQRGVAPQVSPQFETQKRYIYNNAALAEYVHRDVSFQAYLQAGLILLSYGPGALDPSNPYASIANQGAFVSHGPPYILDLITKAANAALNAAWFQKWRVHRFLRPEALGGRVHFHVTGAKSYDLHSDVLNAQALPRVFSKYGTYLLPQAYPEGSPTHPSYPAGHACIAGACVTVLKALFNEAFVIPNPVVARNRGRQLISYSGPDDLTVGGELNKLANNISLGRDAAGVHYRQDGIQGLLAGEQVAKALLKEHASSFNEAGFSGYSFTDFNGNVVTIAS